MAKLIRQIVSFWPEFPVIQQFQPCAYNICTAMLKAVVVLAIVACLLVATASGRRSHRNCIHSSDLSFLINNRWIDPNFVCQQLKSRLGILLQTKGFFPNEEVDGIQVQG